MMAQSCLSTAASAAQRWIGATTKIIKLALDGQTVSLTNNFNLSAQGDPPTLSCHRAPCGWVSRHEYAKKIIGREGLRAAALK
jgi:hypothetical protein